MIDEMEKLLESIYNEEKYWRTQFKIVVNIWEETGPRELASTGIFRHYDFV